VLKTASGIIAVGGAGGRGNKNYFARGDWDWTIHFPPCLGFFQIGRGSAEFAHWPHPMVFFWQDFSRLSPRLGAAKISHNFDFLMKS